MKSTTRIFSIALAFAALATLQSFRIPASAAPMHRSVSVSLMSLPIPTCGPGVPGCDQDGKGGKGGIF